VGIFETSYKFSEADRKKKFAGTFDPGERKLRINWEKNLNKF
jgi:hypothetical protein